MRILISAAEASSDAHGAELLSAIRLQYSSNEDQVEAYGIGGPKLQAAGLKVVVDSRELLAMGFIEVIKHLPKIFSALSRVTRQVRQEVPDIAVVIDYPDFHFRLAKRLAKLGVPVIYYIPPKVWVWRKRRIHFLKKYFVKILSILPFEEEFYKAQNISVKYVGSPLIDELPLHLTKEDARRKLSIKDFELALVVMPGSRKAELKHHLIVMLEAAAASAVEFRKIGKLKADEKLIVLMPLPETAPLDRIQMLVKRWFQSHDAHQLILDVRVSQGNAGECLVAADVGLIKSGTSTLEAGLLRCPHAIVYKPHSTSAWIFKYLIRYKGPVGLVNLVSDCKNEKDYLVPEVLCEKVTTDALKDQVVNLVTDSQKRQMMLQGFERLRKKVCGESMNLSPSATAAREILDVAKNGIRKKS